MGRVVALAALALASLNVFAQDLGPGKAAPPLKVGTWVKGQEVKGFSKGKIYVVEFWATWCGPCRVSIPHLTKLAKENAGKATFVGVSVWERGADIEKSVREFVKNMGDQMDYNVAIDDKDTTMAKTWMQAAGQNGIPTAFIVDKDSKIVWIGHPMSMEEPLKQVVAGTFDKAAFEREFAAEREREKAAGAKRQQIADLRKEYETGDRAKANAELEKLASDEDEMVSRMAWGARFELYAKNDRPAFDALVDTIAKGTDDGQWGALLNFVANTAMRASQNNTAAKQIIGAAGKGGEALVGKPNANTFELFYGGMALGEAGEKAKATDALTRALKAFDADKDLTGDEDMKEFRTAIENAIKKYAPA